MRRTEVNHQFVEAIPDEPAEGIVYIATGPAVVLHRCCCGCGTKITTPLGPSGGKLLFDGKTISLDPSIDNWALDCESHYRIKRSRVRWLARWSQLQVETGGSRV
jgi:uncharacterized protein DUF6527